MQVLLTICIFSYLIFTALAIKCYSCESAYDPRCQDSLEDQAFFKIDCSKVSPPRYQEDDLTNRNSTACLKITYKEHGLRKVRRHCYFGDLNDTEVGCRMDPMITTMEEYACYVCDDMYCNHATNIRNDSPFFKLISLSTIGSFFLTAKLINWK